MQPLMKIAATFGAIATIGGGAWAVGDYTDLRPALKREQIDLAANVESNSQAILLIQFQLLMEKRQRQGLNFTEQQSLCRIARALEYVNVPGC